MLFKAHTPKTRLVTIDVAYNAYAQISISRSVKGGIATVVEGSNPPVYFTQVNESIGSLSDHHVYNMPFLFLRNGLPWDEANSYLFSEVKDVHPNNRPTDRARNIASKLLDYLKYLEDNNLDWLDFSGERLTQRPTYKYYHHLCTSTGRSAAVVNKYTGAVYEFYKYVAKHWHDIEMDRVDSVETIKLSITGNTGSAVLLDVEKRSQTKQTPPTSPVPIDYVREDGEDLRPLTNPEHREFLDIINGPYWSVLERLIHFCSLLTGARKQSVLTLRMKHLAVFQEANLNRDGTYTIYAGPGTGIDTKNDQRQRLHFPKQLAEEIVVYANSKLAKSKRNKFFDKYTQEYPDLEPLKDEDIYLFLSEQGNCYYMAEDDPRYPKVRYPPIGQVTHTLKKKLLKHASTNFPVDFKYHWLRATYAYVYYQRIISVKPNVISPSEIISMIQYRLHHSRRETTENYLKLFNNVNEILKAQELYEDVLFDDLSIILEQGPYGREHREEVDLDEELQKLVGDN